MKHILVVDDNKTDLIAARSVLTEEDYKVTAVTMGSQALKFLENNTCDLILLDVDMPEMDGLEVFRQIKEKNPENVPPVMFLTGNSGADILTRCIDDGGIDIMAKPFVRSVLLNRVALLLELLEYRK